MRCYNVRMLIERLANDVAEKCGLRTDQPVLLGVSGGSDSLALMYGLASLNFDLIIAHVDHGLRPESRQEAEFVEGLAESLGFPFFSQRIEVEKVAEREGQSIEEAARIVRYRFLFDQARRHACQAVAVAHHADDQVETVLMHFLRGAALPGLTGMAYRRMMPLWDPEIPLVRPLLGIWREEIDAYVEGMGLTPCVDLSNLDTTYHRNRIRHMMIPELETYNPQIKAVIWRMADVLRADAQDLDVLTEQAFADCLQGEDEEYVRLNIPKLLGLSTAVKRRVLRQAVTKLRPDLRDVGFDAVARGVTFAEQSSSGSEIDLVARLNLAIIEDELIIKTWQADLPDLGKPCLPSAQFEGWLDLDQAVDLRHGWRIEASLLTDIPKQALVLVKNLSPNEVWLDFDHLTLPLKVRARAEGERFEPLGMGGHSQGLQDFFINLKVPVHLRRLWPLVVSGQRVVWVVGLRPSEDCKVTRETRRILKLKLIKCSN